MSTSALSYLRADARRLGTRARFGLLSYIALAAQDPGFLAAALLRCQQHAFERGHRSLARVARSLAISLTGADFAPGCRIGPGVVFKHTVGIVVGAGAVVGAECTLLQGVTLGERYGHKADDHSYPVVGDRVTLCAGAVALGPVHIGDDVVVGANAVVLSDIPPAHVAVGIPARATPR